MASSNFSPQISKQEQLQLLFDSLYPKVDPNSFGRLLEILAEAETSRSAELKEADQTDRDWYLSNQTIGMMLTIDLFAKDLDGLEEKIPYFKELGITFLQIRPLYEKGAGENSESISEPYSQIDPESGTLAPFGDLVAKLNREGIDVCLDFVVSHAVMEPDESRKVLAGEKDLREKFPDHSLEMFLRMTDALLHLANTGISAIRLEVLPYWGKELSANSHNLPHVHTMLKLFRLMLERVCPRVALLGKASDETFEAVKYFGTDVNPEYQILYHTAHMVEIWNSFATRDVRLMAKNSKYGQKIPHSSCWINYARCNDAISWGFNESIIRALGFSPEAHKQYLISFFKGDHTYSYARGEWYQFHPGTLDARISGTTSSLAGLERALESHDHYQQELAINRILLIHAQILAEAGIPLIYSGDEIATLNDYTYQDNPVKAPDSRWLHRPLFNWDRAEKRHDLATPEGQVFQTLKQLIRVRSENDLFRADIPAIIIECNEKAVYSFVKYRYEDVLIFLANYSEDRQFVDTAAFHGAGIFGKKVDLISGKTVDFNQDRILLGPFEYVWLKGHA